MGAVKGVGPKTAEAIVETLGASRVEAVLDSYGAVKALLKVCILGMGLGHAWQGRVQVGCI